MQVSLIPSLTPGTLFVALPHNEEGLLVEEREQKLLEASDVIVLIRDPKSLIGDYVVSAKATSNSSALKLPIGAHVRVLERLEDPLLQEDEDTRQILSRLFSGKDLRDNEKEKIVQGKLEIKDPRNIQGVIEDGTACGKVFDDYGLVAQYCHSLVNEDTWVKLKKLIDLHKPNEHRFIDGLRENTKLIEFITSHSDAVAS